MKFIALIVSFLLVWPANSQQLQTGTVRNNYSGEIQADRFAQSANAIQIQAILSKHPEREPYLYDGMAGVGSVRKTYKNGWRTVTENFMRVTRVDPRSQAFGRIFENDLILAVDGRPIADCPTKDEFKRERAGTWCTYTVSHQQVVSDVSFQSVPLFWLGDFSQDFYMQGQLNPEFSPYFTQLAPGQPYKFSGTVDPHANHH